MNYATALRWVAAMNAFDRLAEESGNRDLLDLRARLRAFGERDGVADDHFAQGRVGDALDGALVDGPDLGLRGQTFDDVEGLLDRVRVGRSDVHRAVVVHEFGQHADRRQTGEPAQIDAGLGMARPHQHAACLRHQRKHMSRPHEIGGAGIAIGERAHGIAALFGGNAGGEPVADVDRYRKRGAERRIVERHHRIEVQPAGFLRRQRRADDAGRVADDKRHLLRRAEARRDEQVAFVFAVVVIGDDDDLAAREGGDGGLDA